ncbi:MAG: hypothetical protein PVH88_15660 [Ignavibacteria bacterium]|jgi:hypothetical protein
MEKSREINGMTLGQFAANRTLFRRKRRGIKPRLLVRRSEGEGGFGLPL